MCFVRLVLGSGGALLAAVISLGGEKKEEKERGAGGMKGKLVVDGPEGAELPTCELWRGVEWFCSVEHRTGLGGVQSSLVWGTGGPGRGDGVL